LKASFDLAPVLEAVDTVRTQTDQAPILKAIRESKPSVDLAPALEEIRKIGEGMQSSASTASAGTAPDEVQGLQERHLRQAVEELREAMDKVRIDQQVLEEIRAVVDKAAARDVDLSPLVAAIQEIRIEVDNSEVLAAIRESGSGGRHEGNASSSAALPMGDLSSTSGSTAAMMQELAGLRADVAQLARLDFAPLASAIRGNLRTDVAAACSEDLQRLQLEVSGLRNLDFTPLVNAIRERSAEVDFTGVLVEIEKVKQDVAGLASDLRHQAPRPTMLPAEPSQEELKETVSASSSPD